MRRAYPAANLELIPHPCIRPSVSSEGESCPFPNARLPSRPARSSTRRRPCITRDILQSYLLCKVKGHLKLLGERGSPCDYETLMTELRAKLAQGAAEKLAVRLDESDVVRDIKITTAVLKRGKPLILHAKVEAEGVRVEIDGLKRVEGASKLGDFHYLPILFFEGEKVRPDQRRLLELCGLLVGDLQGKQPAHGLIVYGKGLKISKIEFRSGSRATRRIIEEVNALASAGSPQAHPERSLPGLRVPAALSRPGREGGQPQPAPIHRREGGRKPMPGRASSRSPSFRTRSGPAGKARGATGDRTSAIKHWRPWRSGTGRSTCWARPRPPPAP